MTKIFLGQGWILVELDTKEPTVITRTCFTKLIADQFIHANTLYKSTDIIVNEIE